MRSIPSALQGEHRSYFCGTGLSKRLGNAAKTFVATCDGRTSKGVKEGASTVDDVRPVTVSKDLPFKAQDV